MTPTSYQPRYSNSRALVIGIDRYQNASPLAYAGNDAKGIARALNGLGFESANVELLLDGAATKQAILKAFLKFTESSIVQPDDRILMFFAGHGHTVSGRRGEVGFLVPVDGEVTDLSTLIRWNEFIDNGDLIPAKHVFFLMDACYGGLALARSSFPPGSMRFLKDMLQRHSRQVLTAGKANEQVADGNGTRPGNSIFTGHVLDALERIVPVEGDILSASTLMSHIYNKVGRDPKSRQTPHYGFIDGDGDFIFDLAPLKNAKVEQEKGSDVLIKLSSSPSPAVGALKASLADDIKALLLDNKGRIRLEDLIFLHLKDTIAQVGIGQFPVQGQFNAQTEFVNRIVRYEAKMADLLTISILLARWSDASHLHLLEKILTKIAEIDKGTAGTVLWLRLGWYPTLLLIYAVGITAIGRNRPDVLAVALKAKIRSDQFRGHSTVPLPVLSLSAMVELHENFKWLPGHEGNYVPRSEHMFKILQPVLEDLNFFGQGYDDLFDKFEILLALTYGEFLRGSKGGQVWGPPGRFMWKHRESTSASPFTEFVEEARTKGDLWPWVDAELFGGSAANFLSLAEAYMVRMESSNRY